MQPASSGWVETLDGRINNCTTGSGSGPCSALYANGAAPTLRARVANGTGLYFMNWSAPTACTAYGTGAVCLVQMTASVTAIPVFAGITQNLAFATSSYVPANLGGVAPYDAYCNTVASDAGINNTTGTGYIAWISTVTNSASTRLTATGSFKRLDGQPFALNETELLANKIRNPVNLDELGRRMNSNDSIWTGTNSSGIGNMSDCVGWTVNTATTLNRGIPPGGPGLWTDGTGGHTCNNTGTRLLCIGNTSTFTMSIPLIPTGGKRHVPHHPVPMPTSNANADSTCTTQANAAGYTGAYKALLSSTTANAADQRGPARQHHLLPHRWLAHRHGRGDQGRQAGHRPLADAQRRLPAARGLRLAHLDGRGQRQHHRGHHRHL